MASKVKWHGKAVMSALDREMRKRYLKAAGLVRNRATQLVGKSGAGKYEKAGFGVEGDKVVLRRKGSKKVGESRSKPGEPPLQQTGLLKKSLKVRPRGKGARVYSRDRKAHLLEYGSRKMLPRPFLRRALAESRSQVKAILSRPLPRKK